jgi:hypothetical protein
MRKAVKQYIFFSIELLVKLFFIKTLISFYVKSNAVKMHFIVKWVLVENE